MYVSGIHYMTENRKQLEIHGDQKANLITGNTRKIAHWEANCTMIKSQNYLVFDLADHLPRLSSIVGAFLTPLSLVNFLVIHFPPNSNDRSQLP